MRLFSWLSSSEKDKKIAAVRKEHDEAAKELDTRMQRLLEENTLLIVTLFQVKGILDNLEYNREKIEDKARWEELQTNASAKLLSVVNGTVERLLGENKCSSPSNADAKKDTNGKLCCQNIGSAFTAAPAPNATNL